MTQDVQPLTWSRRTNLEEHQQFFSKINEIIDNLAPTVDEAEAAIAQATAAIASANDAIATANAASAAASAAASQAQTAASTVAGYDTRLTAAEGDIDALQAADQTIAGNVAALGTRMTAAESKNSQQDTDIAALQTADAQNVKINRINDYAVGLTGNQGPITGTKMFRDNIIGFASLGNNGNSESITIGSYKSILRIARSNLSTFRGVLSIISWERANGRNPEFVQIGMHGNTAVSINRYSVSGSTTCDYFVSSDDSYVYIGIKSRVSNINDNAKQLIVLSLVGFNVLTPIEAYNGSVVSTPEGTLIAETS